jgi:hypothetical protein
MDLANSQIVKRYSALVYNTESGTESNVWFTNIEGLTSVLLDFCPLIRNALAKRKGTILAHIHFTNQEI